MTRRLVASLWALFASSMVLSALASASEVVVLKGGKTLELSKPYVVRGSQALMTLKDGTLISVAAADIDRAATDAARRAKPAPEQVAQPASPAEAAKAQKDRAKARVKIGDSDVGHVLDTGEVQPAAAEAAAEAESADAKLQVVDFDQRPASGALSVKGTIRNSGKTVAENIALSVSAIDDAGKSVATTNAVVAAGSLEPGSTATFTASLPMAVKASTLRFTPRWSGAPSMPKAEGAAPANGSAPATAPAATAKPVTPPPPPPAEPKTTYKPQPDYAPPPANAPMTAPDDNHYGYIPGAHEENPPPPPPPPPTR